MEARGKSPSPFPRPGKETKQLAPAPASSALQLDSWPLPPLPPPPPVACPSLLNYDQKTHPVSPGHRSSLNNIKFNILRVVSPL